MRIGDSVISLTTPDFVDVFIEELQKVGVDIDRDTFEEFDPTMTKNEDACLDAFVTATQRWFNQG